MADSASSNSGGEGTVLRIEPCGNTVVITPQGDLGEFVVSAMAEEAEAALARWDDPSQRRHLILNLQRTDYFGSSALGFFIRLWKRVRESGGRMILCNVSSHERDLLKITRLDEFWEITDSLDDANALVSRSEQAAAEKS